MLYVQNLKLQNRWQAIAKYDRQQLSENYD